VDRVPEQLRTRMLAVRAFDANAMMRAWEVVGGQQVEEVIERLFKDADAAYLHVRYAAPGCYAARVDRA
jgi:transcriptional regulator